jgi:uncharacterized protein (TIGR04255 family)
MGVEFERLAQWSVPHFGLFYQEIRDEYPQFDVHAPLVPNPTVTARPGAEFLAVRAGVIPDVRCWFINHDSTRLIQVQRDRFIHNWRKCDGGDYPHYETIKPIFEADWRRFLAFLESNGLGKPSIRQCEITYINHIEQGLGWDSFAQLGEVLRYWAGDQVGDFLPPLQDAGLALRYAMPAEKGILHIQMDPVIRHQDGKELIQLSLTTRGRPKSGEWTDVSEWLDLGHVWIVNGFEAITTDKMHTIWGKEQVRHAGSRKGMR